jgi:hypothetical protein
MCWQVRLGRSINLGGPRTDVFGEAFAGRAALPGTAGAVQYREQGEVGVLIESEQRLESDRVELREPTATWRTDVQ